MSEKYLINKWILLFFFALAAPANADDSTFPQPAELQRDVDFWVSIFTAYNTSEGALHDNRNLAVVYERVNLPASVSRTERNRRAERRRQDYQAILRTLGAGKRTGLTVEEQRVLALWPAGTSNQEFLDAVEQIRFQQGLSDRFREGLVRAGRWRAHVNAELTKHGVPIALAALPHVESSYNPDARSHLDASGIWQFTRSTGRRFMQVDHVLDERNDPFIATEGAARLLAYNYSIAGNWPMAITAYNHGLSGARRAMAEFGDEEYVKILREYRGRTFGFASRNFYVAFLAAKHVDQNVDQYFPGLVPDKPVNYQTYVLPEYLPIAAISDVLGISERELGSYNPALQATVFQGSKLLPRQFEIRVPDARLSSPLEQLIAKVPTDRRFAKQLPDLFHTVARGDTLSEIADEYGTRVTTLVALNSLGSSHRIRIGQQIRLPAAGPAPVAVAAKAKDTPPVATTEAPTEVAVAPVAETRPADVIVADDPVPDGDVAADIEAPGAMTDVLAPAADSTVQTVLLSDPSDYTVASDTSIEVQPMETLGHFADWLGIKTQRLRDINRLVFREPVEVGQRIKLDLSKVEAATFENLRSEYHRRLQDDFFRSHRIDGIREHTVKQGESVWILSLRQYGVPIWLFRQYNPELNLHNVQPGTKIHFPIFSQNINESDAG